MSTFDVFLKGINPKRLEEADEIKQLACQYLKIEMAELDKLLNAAGPSCLRRGVSEDEAQAYQLNLAKIGIICVCRPGAAVSKLSLTAIESEDTPGNVYVCPHCNHQETIEENKPAPTQCSKCGVIAEKFLETQKLKAETAEIRNNILRTQRAKESFENKHKQEAAEERRKEELEKKVLQELKIKKTIDEKKLKIAAISVAGLLIVGGLSYWLSSTFTGQDSPAQGSQAVHQGNPEQSNGQGVSMQEGYEKANKVLNSVGLDANALANNTSAGALPPDPDVLVDGESPGASNTQATSAPPASGVVPADQNSAAPTAADTASTSAVLAKGDNVPEWDLFLNNKINSLITKNKLPAALQLSKQIVDQETSVKAIGEVLSAAQKSKNAKWVAESLTTLENTTCATPIDTLVDCLALAGQYQLQATGKNSLLERAEQIFTTLTDPASQLKSSLKLAVSYYKAGSIEGANRYFTQTVELFNKVPAEQKITSRVDIARAHYEVGDKANAQKWLESGLSAGNISSQSRQALVEACAYTDQLQHALDLTKSATSNEQSKLLLAAINVSLTSGLTQNASALTNEIQDPAYKALALDQIVGYQSPANATLVLAEQQLPEIKDASAQATVASLLARHYVRAGDAAKANELTKLAIQKMGELPLASKDEVRIVITKNLARSLQIDAAKAQADLIQSPAIKDEANAEITKSIEINKILKAL